MRATSKIESIGSLETIDNIFTPSVIHSYPTLEGIFFSATPPFSNICLIFTLKLKNW